MIVPGEQTGQYGGVVVGTAFSLIQTMREHRMRFRKGAKDVLTVFTSSGYVVIRIVWVDNRQRPGTVDILGLCNSLAVEVALCMMQYADLLWQRTVQD